MSSITTTLQGTNLALPSSLNTIAKPATTTPATSGSPSADGGLGSTFLGLLSQELQNQDPTAPVDSTQMVAQMISLNQLDQLINISQAVQSIVSGAISSTGASTTGASAAHATASAQPATSAASASSPTPAGAAAAASYQLPFDPSTMLPVNMQSPGGVSTQIAPAVGASASLIK